jgi:hypothetical protein
MKKFFELRRGKKFRFASSEAVYISAGVDGAYGRYVFSEEDIADGRWAYCSPLEEVEEITE